MLRGDIVNFFVDVGFCFIFVKDLSELVREIL